MSLVAYAASSDEDSDNEESNETAQVEVAQSKPSTTQNLVQTSVTITTSTIASATNGHISDDDDDYAHEEISLDDLKPSTSKFALTLPKPKHVQDETDIDDIVIPTFAKLPMPRSAPKAIEIIEEVDDEFLHKKAVPPPAEEILQKPPPPLQTARARVQITIPSLKDFKDVEQEQAEKSKNRNQKIGNSSKGSSLLCILPQAKSERNFSKVETKTKDIPSATTTTSTTTSTTVSATVRRPAFIPDTVSNRRPAYNTEGVDGIKAMPKKLNTKVETSKKTTLLNRNASDSDDEDNESHAGHKVGDFFSLNSEEKLPEVSANEINALVAKRAARIAEATDKYLNEAAAAQEEAEAERMQIEEEEMRQAQKRCHEQKLNTEAMDALVGKNAKRRRKEAHEMQVIDISSSEVLPDREEWMRTALTSATTYQPTGVLNDEEPVAGTRRKHQITYLAHKAKSNEAELQAMWAANRQTRRATQSKYGF